MRSGPEGAGGRPWTMPRGGGRLGACGQTSITRFVPSSQRATLAAAVPGSRAAMLWRCAVAAPGSPVAIVAVASTSDLLRGPHTRSVSRMNFATIRAQADSYSCFEEVSLAKRESSTASAESSSASRASRAAVAHRTICELSSRSCSSIETALASRASRPVPEQPR